MIGMDFLFTSHWCTGGGSCGTIKENVHEVDFTQRLPGSARFNISIFIAEPFQQRRLLADLLKGISHSTIKQTQDIGHGSATNFGVIMGTNTVGHGLAEFLLKDPLHWGAWEEWKTLKEQRKHLFPRRETIPW